MPKPQRSIRSSRPSVCTALANSRSAIWRFGLALVPAIVTKRMMHAVAVSFGEKMVTVHDPAWPVPREFTFAEYGDRYGGFAVVVRPRR